MKLPNGQRAEIGDKLEEYCLNVDHPRGKHKARVFDAVLGITVANSYVLKQALLDAAFNSDSAIECGDNGYGMTFRLVIPLVTSRGNARAMTAWLIEKGTDFPRLTTCYII